MSRRRGKSGRNLSAEDQALWKQFSQNVEPIDGKGRVGADSRATQVQNDSRETSVKQSSSDQPDASIARKASGKPKPASPSAPMKKTGTARTEIAAFETRRAKRIGAGRQAIDARIDLHGLRQAEARSALRRFLFGAMANTKASKF